MSWVIPHDSGCHGISPQNTPLLTFLSSILSSSPCTCLLREPLNQSPKRELPPQILLPGSPALRGNWLSYKERLPFILGLADESCHLSNIVIAFWNHSKAVEDSPGLDVLILRTMKNLAKDLEEISAILWYKTGANLLLSGRWCWKTVCENPGMTEGSQSWRATWRKSWHRRARRTTPSCTVLA